MAENDRTDVYQDIAGEWRWRRLAGNNKIIATSGEAFDSKSNAERAANRVFPQGGRSLPLGLIAVLVALAWLATFLLGFALGARSERAERASTTTTMVTATTLATSTSLPPVTSSSVPSPITSTTQGIADAIPVTK